MLGATILEENLDADAFGVLTSQELSNGVMTIDRTVQAESGRVESIKAKVHNSSSYIAQLESKWRSDGLVYERASLGSSTAASDDARETFTYDALKRLSVAQSSLGASLGRKVTHDYDLFGNITSIDSDVVGEADTPSLTYASSASPHRLTSALVDGVSTTFSYDANGNITAYNATGADDTAITYDALNQVTDITVGSSNGPSADYARDEFEYGPEGARFIKRSEWNEAGTIEESITVYLAGGLFEEVHPLHDPSVAYYRKVQASGAALVRQESDGLGTTTSVEYLHRDHLGSVVAVTDDAGVVLHKMGYDAFGERRSSDWDADLTALEEAAIEAALGKNTSRGYTDHEHLERTGFVHMNGRVYDPRIGRFIQPDPLVGQPSFSQNYNRYAYVLNRPSSFADPTGLDCGDATEDCGSMPGGPSGAVGLDYDLVVTASQSSGAQLASAAIASVSFGGGGGGGGGGGDGGEELPHGPPSSESAEEAAAASESAGARQQAECTGSALECSRKAEPDVPEVAAEVPKQRIDHAKAVSGLVGVGLTMLGVAACALLAPCGAFVLGTLAVGGTLALNTYAQGATGENYLASLIAFTPGISKDGAATALDVVDWALVAVNPIRKGAGSLAGVGVARFGASQLDNRLDVVAAGATAIGQRESKP